MYTCLTRVRCAGEAGRVGSRNRQRTRRTTRGSDARRPASSSSSRFPVRIGYAAACLPDLTPLLGAGPRWHRPLGPGTRVRDAKADDVVTEPVLDRIW